MKFIKLLFIVFFLTSYSQLGVTAQLQSIASIQEAIDRYITENLSKNTDFKIKHSHLDRRLKLVLCNKPLETFSHSRALKPGRNSIGVKCNGEKKWTIYSSVNISIYGKVVVLTQPIRRGQIFHKDALRIEKRDLSTLRSGVVSNKKLIINKQATRNLSKGSVISSSNFAEAKIIKRGEKVYITTNSPYLEISMAGIAMMDGVKGQNIKVRNIKSQQIIQGIVSKQGQVVVLF